MFGLEKIKEIDNIKKKLGRTTQLEEDIKTVAENVDFLNSRIDTAFDEIKRRDNLDKIFKDTPAVEAYKDGDVTKYRVNYLDVAEGVVVQTCREGFKNAEEAKKFVNKIHEARRASPPE